MCSISSGASKEDLNDYYTNTAPKLRNQSIKKFASK